MGGNASKKSTQLRQLSWEELVTSRRQKPSAQTHATTSNTSASVALSSPSPPGRRTPNRLDSPIVLDSDTSDSPELELIGESQRKSLPKPKKAVPAASASKSKPNLSVSLKEAAPDKNESGAKGNDKTKHPTSGRPESSKAHDKYTIASSTKTSSAHLSSSATSKEKESEQTTRELRKRKSPASSDDEDAYVPPAPKRVAVAPRKYAPDSAQKQDTHSSSVRSSLDSAQNSSASTSSASAGEKRLRDRSLAARLRNDSASDAHSTRKPEKKEASERSATTRKPEASSEERSATRKKDIPETSFKRTQDKPDPKSSAERTITQSSRKSSQQGASLKKEPQLHSESHSAASSSSSALPIKKEIKKEPESKGDASASAAARSPAPARARGAGAGAVGPGAMPKRTQTQAGGGGDVATDVADANEAAAAAAAADENWDALLDANSDEFSLSRLLAQIDSGPAPKCPLHAQCASHGHMNGRDASHVTLAGCPYYYHLTPEVCQVCPVFVVLS